MHLFSVPKWLSEIQDILASRQNDDSLKKDIADAIRKMSGSQPEVSVVIPAWNESKNLLPTLLCLSRQKTAKQVEFILVDNNSSDNTGELAATCGFTVITETTQGISFARQAGLTAAKGKYHLCADADTLYPPDWIDALTAPLIKHSDVTCVYNNYSFIPQPGAPRFALAVFEKMARFIFFLRKRKKEFLNVMGFSFAFRTADGLQVGGFNTTRPRWSDGWMGMLLAEKGRLYKVTSSKSLVWTIPRRLMIDGGIYKSLLLRVKKEIQVIKEYF